MPNYHRDYRQGLLAPALKPKPKHVTGQAKRKGHYGRKGAQATHSAQQPANSSGNPARSACQIETTQLGGPTPGPLPTPALGAVDKTIAGEQVIWLRLLLQHGCCKPVSRPRGPGVGWGALPHGAQGRKMQHTTASHRSAANGVKMSPAGTSALRTRTRQSRPANLRSRSGYLVTAPHAQLLFHKPDLLLAARALSCARAVQQKPGFRGCGRSPHAH